MDIFLKITAGILVAAILCLILTKQGVEISMLLCLAVCGMALATALSYLSPVLVFAHKLVQLGELHGELMEILLKATGIGVLSQTVSLICEDIGNKSLSKVLQFTAAATVLCISVPVLESLIELIETLLGEV